MSALNHCQRGGYLVSAAYPVPADPGEFFPEGAVWKVGCNQLTCSACGQRVRQATGYFALPEADGHEHEIFDRAPEGWAALPYLDHGPGWQDQRLYACACTFYNQGDATPLADEGDDRRLPPWRCSGHPLAVPWERYYGIEVGPYVNWAALAARAFMGWRPPEVAAERNSPPQGVWLRALYRRLLGTPMAESLSRAAAGCLTHADPMVRAGALRFFYALPGAPGGERLEELAAGDRALFRGFKNPYPTEEPDLEAWLLTALAERQAQGT